ncbi:S-adenosylmethionine-dependent methyltransferase Rv2258c-like [Mytilus californianus]|uniref:S-adenosylmethionine-dependent methyltransferase Rv2258c-like n=1 Tax=Mytilus californianus TaxID=6549 RepID=UPI0022453B15|nr:S-adenosylmethionine-dependent methyltransferase Rv2258c-like [Mytilus californianus]
MLASRIKVSSYRSPILEPEEYADRFSSTVTNGFIALEIAIGYKLGLFCSLNEFTSPVTTTELAISCKLKERYVREWLGCMSAAGFVSITPDDKYFIPEACKPHTESSKLASVFPHIAANTSSVLECFKEDGPKGYDYSNQLDTLMWLDHDKKSCDSKWINENLFPVGHIETGIKQ